VRAWYLSATLFLLASCASSATSTPNIVASRADGEGHAGRGELVLRLRVYAQDASGVLQWLAGRREQATVEILYRGLDESGRALFERRDLDRAAAQPGTTAAQSTREIALDLRVSRLLRVQEKVLEVREADPSGVDFRLY
jgi:hypothetical protein